MIDRTKEIINREKYLQMNLFNFNYEFSINCRKLKKV